MLHTEWSLVFFTTIAQWAAGIMIAVLPFVFAKNQNRFAKLNHTAFYFAAGLIFGALVLSFFHLNNPVNAFYALGNLETSWLSWEILLVSVFLFCLVLVNLILHIKTPEAIYYKTFILVTAIMGVIMVYTMSQLYMIPTVPAWNGISTMIEFYSTALLMGATFVLGLSFHYRTKTNQKIAPANKTRVVVSIALLAVVLILINVLFFNQPVKQANIAFKPEPLNQSFLFLRWITIALGAGSMFYIIHKRDRLKNMRLAFYLPFAFFLISELIARAAFYASFYRIGL
ncbi:MAG: dimethyl sulfoxide reductase anchor subunit [Bacteroidales bacterium]|nr:dimethyl sulfoxide reductase anchor subunit [Bacteroidales bacterium]